MIKYASSKPLGFHDIYWCGVVNEPVILEYQNGKPCCTFCGMPETHDFICHVSKPVDNNAYKEYPLIRMFNKFYSKLDNCCRLG